MPRAPYPPEQLQRTRNLRVSDPEWATLAAAAERANMGLTTFIREAALTIAAEEDPAARIQARHQAERIVSLLQEAAEAVSDAGG